VATKSKKIPNFKKSGNLVATKVLNFTPIDFLNIQNRRDIWFERKGYDEFFHA
jgi:hypothetical protein